MQKSFSDLEYASKKKLTRRDRFLAEIEKITPWEGNPPTKRARSEVEFST